MDDAPQLVVMSGLPGVGKSTLAGALAQKIGALWLRIDSIEDALADSTLHIHPADDAGYLAACAVARDNLGGLRTVIADAVNPDDWCRTLWRDLAAETDARLTPIQVVCSDTDEHRRRVAARDRGPDWQGVLTRGAEPWPGAPVIDTAHHSVDAAVMKMEELLNA
ncbi:MAG: AAA family ATPase [Paracoccaceae bacterium]